MQKSTISEAAPQISQVEHPGIFSRLLSGQEELEHQGQDDLDTYRIVGV